MAKKKVTLENLSGLDALSLRRGKPTPETENATEANVTQERDIGEKPGKKDDLIQISAYIPKELHKRVRIAIASQEEHSLTSLLIKLLSNWVDEQR